MRRMWIGMILCACAGLYAGQKSDAPVSALAGKNVFLEWFDISPDSWAPLGYGDKETWVEVTDRNFRAFQSVLQTRLPDRRVTGAKARTDEDTAGQDILIRASDVRFDVDTYRLYLSIQFIDPKSGKLLKSIPLQGYRGGRFTVDNCLRGALEKVADRLIKELSTRTPLPKPEEPAA